MPKKSEHRKAFEEFVKKVRKELGNSLVKIILYGSVVRGEIKKESDVDVILIVKGDKGKVKEKVIDIAYKILMEREIYISPKVLTESDYKRLKSARSLFLRSVEKEGELIHA